MSDFYAEAQWRDAFLGEDLERPRRRAVRTLAWSFDLDSREALEMFDALNECSREGRPHTRITWMQFATRPLALAC